MLTWWGHPITTAEASNTDIFQTFIPSNNIIVDVISSAYVFYNDPTFTNIFLKVYTNLDGSPDQLIMTSTDTWLSDEIYTNGYLGALKKLKFNFDKHPFKADESYHVVTNISGYTYADGTHIAWRNTYPDPTYTLNLTQSTKRLLNYPYDIVVEGAILK